MADRTDKNPLNVRGTYYNDLSCIDCDMCREIAPEVFARDEAEGLSYVWRQPVSAGSSPPPRKRGWHARLKPSARMAEVGHI